MEEDDKGCPMIRMGVCGWVFLLVPAYLSCLGPKTVKRLCVCVCSLNFPVNTIAEIASLGMKTYENTY